MAKKLLKLMCILMILVGVILIIAPQTYAEEQESGSWWGNLWDGIKETILNIVGLGDDSSYTEQERLALSSITADYKGLTFERVCEPVYEDCIKTRYDPIYEEQTFYYLIEYNESNKGCKQVEINETLFCNESYKSDVLVEYKPVEYSICNIGEQYKIIKCEPIGVIKVENKIYSFDRYFCDLNEAGTIECDELIGKDGSMGDSNGNGRCEPGERCFVLDQINVNDEDIVDIYKHIKTNVDANVDIDSIIKIDKDRFNYKDSICKFKDDKIECKDINEDIEDIHRLHEI